LVGLELLGAVVVGIVVVDVVVVNVDEVIDDEMAVTYVMDDVDVMGQVTVGIKLIITGTMTPDKISGTVPATA